MSITRRIKRAREREVDKHFAVFSDILMGFYEILEKTPQPSGEAIRSAFIEREQCWKRYCSHHKLSEETSLLFNKEVSISWEKRYKKQPNELTVK